MSEKDPAYDEMCRIAGNRHATCRLDNFQIGNDSASVKRQIALDRVVQYAIDFRANTRNGRNLILIGTCGTGKDHLAVGVIRSTLGRGVTVRYVTGATLCSTCREHSLEYATEVPDIYMNTDLLVISDIEPSREKVSAFEERVILTLINHRYCKMLPTIVTTNRSSKSELANLIGERTVDRLYQDAVVVPMKWDSYRKQGVK